MLRRKFSAAARFLRTPLQPRQAFVSFFRVFSSEVSYLKSGFFGVISLSPSLDLKRAQRIYALIFLLDFPLRQIAMIELNWCTLIALCFVCVIAEGRTVSVFYQRSLSSCNKSANCFSTRWNYWNATREEIAREDRLSRIKVRGWKITAQLYIYYKNADRLSDRSGPRVEIARRVSRCCTVRFVLRDTRHPLFVGWPNNQRSSGMKFIPQTCRPLALKGCVCLAFWEISFLFSSRRDIALALF